MSADDKSSTTTAPGLCEVAVADIIAMAVEHWRLTTWANSAGSNIGNARHAVRRMGDVLARLQVEVRSLDGRPFDAGLAARVVDTIDDPSAASGLDVVDETVSPMVLLRGTVFRPAEVVVRRGTGKR